MDGVHVYIRHFLKKSACVLKMIVVFSLRSICTDFRRKFRRFAQ